MSLASTTRAVSAMVFAAVFGLACDRTASKSDGGTGEDGGSHHGDGGPNGGSHGDGSVAKGDAGGSNGGGDAGGANGAGDSGSSNGGSGGGGTGGGASGSAKIVHTLAYHQVSAFKASPTGQPMISANGSSIVYTIGPGTENAATPNEIYVIKPDGTGNKKVDSYKTNCFCGSSAVISGNAATVVSSDSTQVRVVGSDATMKGAINFDSNEVANIGVTENGDTVFMLQRRDNKITGGANVERGIWAMNPDASNHRQLVSPSAIATLLGATVDQVFPFAGCGKSMEFSHDGTRGVFAVEVASMGQFVMTIEGSTVNKVKGPYQFVKQVAISSDGSKVAASTQEQSVEEVTIMNFDGSKARVITQQSQGSCFAPLSLNVDGTQLLSGDTALLFPTGGGDPVPLYLVTTGDGTAIGSPWTSVEALFSMSADAKRFVYWGFDAANIMQLGLLELDPKDLGAAPAVTSPAITMGSIPRDRSVGANVSCKISDDTLVRAGTLVLLHGLEDTAGSWVAGQQVLRDDGMGVDATAKDGTFTAGPITAGDGATVGARVVRIKAEAKASDGRLHATVLDVSGLQVK